MDAAVESLEEARRLAPRDLDVAGSHAVRPLWPNLTPDYRTRNVIICPDGIDTESLVEKMLFPGT